MKDKTKRFLMSGVMVMGIFLITGSIWLTATSEGSTLKKVFIFIWAGVIIYFCARIFYKEIIKTGEISIKHGVFCELEVFFLDGKEEKSLFEETIKRVKKLGDLTFFTRVEITEGKKMVKKLTSKSCPVIPINELFGKKVEVLIGTTPKEEFEKLGIRYRYYIRVNGRKK